MVKDSRMSGFYKLDVDRRLEKVAGKCDLDEEDLRILKKDGPLSIINADKMTENVIGTVGLPLSVAPNFIVNKKEYVVPMAVEEPSVVAAAANAAKMCRDTGGFTCEYSGSIMTGQIQIVKIKDIDEAVKRISEKQQELIEHANSFASHLHDYGGGVRGINTRSIATDRGRMLVVEFLIDVIDAMGANAVNTVLESIAPEIEEITKGEARLRILTNLCTYRMVSATAVFKKEQLGGDVGIEKILDAWSLAMADPYRRSTHDKGIMNGIDAVALAVGNDWRAIEAGAHSYANMKNSALTHYWKNDDGDLVGKITLPLAVGTIGGSIRINPTAKICLKILGVDKASDLSMIMASVGLAQNLAALRALALTGIQKGHMRLHARNVASSVGAKEEEMDKVIEIMINNGKVNEKEAKKALERIRKGE